MKLTGWAAKQSASGCGQVAMDKLAPRGCSGTIQGPWRQGRMCRCSDYSRFLLKETAAPLVSSATSTSAGTVIRTLKWPAVGLSAFGCLLMEFSALFLQGSRASLRAAGCEGGSMGTVLRRGEGLPGLVVASHEAAVVRGDKEPGQVVEVRRWEEVQASYMGQVQGRLLREALAEHLDERGPLGVRDLLGTFLRARGPWTPGCASCSTGITGTPWPRVSRSSWWLCSCPGTCWCSSSAPCPSPLVLAVWDVILGLGVAGLLGQVQVDDVGGVLLLGAQRPPPPTTTKKILGLHIRVDEVLVCVFSLQAGDQKDCDCEHCFENECAVGVEQVLHTEQLQLWGVVLPPLVKGVRTPSVSLSCSRKQASRYIQLRNQDLTGSNLIARFSFV